MSVSCIIGDIYLCHLAKEAPVCQLLSFKSHCFALAVFQFLRGGVLGDNENVLLLLNLISTDLGIHRLLFGVQLMVIWYSSHFCSVH